MATCTFEDAEIGTSLHRRRLRGVQFLGADGIQRSYLLDLHFIDDPAPTGMNCAYSKNEITPATENVGFRQHMRIPHMNRARL